MWPPCRLGTDRLSAIRMMRPVVLTAILLAASLVGCSKRSAPIQSASDDLGYALSGLAIPLDVREYEVSHAAGHRGVFLKLSRLPDSVAHYSKSDPARIIIEVMGPTGEEVPEENFPGRDTLVSQLRISRGFGVLRVVLDLQGDDPPDYSVHTMADWIMIRLAPRESSDLGSTRSVV